MPLFQKLHRSIFLGSLALAAAGLVSLPVAGHAQDQEKGATKLLWNQPIATASDVQALQPGAPAAMSCPKCKNSHAVVVEKSFKATVPDATAPVSTHLCPNCTTTIVPQGGQRDAKVVHACNAARSATTSCCASKPSVTATEGLSK
jgi:hypothetical protein